MKKIILFASGIIIFTFAHAQFYKALRPSTLFNDSLTKIVSDFRNDFMQIQGKELTPQVGMEVYQSKITLPGTLHCTIYRYHSKLDTSASWQAVMYDGDSYEDAVKIYKDTYRLITKSRIKWLDYSFVSFIGAMEKPDENLSFATSLLQLNVTDPRYKNFVAEIEITGGYSGWEVHLNLHNKKADKDKD